MIIADGYDWSMIVHRTELRDVQTAQADVLAKLGDIPADRLVNDDFDCLATVERWIEAGGPSEMIELVDGYLVRKALSVEASLVALAIGSLLRTFVKQDRLGYVTAPDGMHRMRRGNRRGPDVGVTLRTSLGPKRPMRGPAAPIAPDLAVEVLSPGNTCREMTIKRAEYFDSGTRLVWIVDVQNRSVAVYTGVEEFEVLGAVDVIDGAEVLPGFTARVAEFFEDLDDQSV